MQIYLLWHVRHARNLDGSPVKHRDRTGELIWDEEYDDLKILGTYSSEERAYNRIERARQLPGFRDEPDCFMVSHYKVDEDLWVEGFVTVRSDP